MMAGLCMGAISHILSDTNLYNPILGQLSELNAGLKEIADRHQVGVAQIPVAWAVAKGTLPIIGVTKVSHVEDVAKAVKIVLTADEIAMIESLADKAVNAIRMCKKR